MTSEADDRRAIANVIHELYTTISGPAGPRDWAKSRALFHDSGRQMRTGVDQDGKSWIKVMRPEQYRSDVQPVFSQVDFYEHEIQHRTDIMGNMAHVWSLYEARHDLKAQSAERRGVNSIQLFKDERGQWKIVSMIWDNERPGVAAAPFLSSD